MRQKRLTSEERKRAIINAALPLFAEKGFGKTTTRDLAEAAGISEPLLYKHFPSKEALYREIQDFSCRETDPITSKLRSLPPSGSALVHLVYFLTRLLVQEKPGDAISWEMRFRLMIHSFLEDGSYARLMHRNRFEPFCAQIVRCIQAGINSGEITPGPTGGMNAAYFAHHVGAWIALTNLPGKPTLNYGVGKKDQENLVEEAVWFCLRGMGMKDEAIKTHFNSRALGLFF
ncbi:MAG TPA: TetR/AcrR family transcriptional regulator [Verrucomicrobiae bacterium]|nr:TetR/AcrR family transcriptional regulator [Verrucomicrobiae bacterium]